MEFSAVESDRLVVRTREVGVSFEDNKAVVREFLETVLLHTRGDIEHMRDHLAPDVVVHTAPLVSGVAGGDEQLHDESRTFGTALPDFDLQIEEMVADGDLVAVHL